MTKTIVRKYVLTLSLSILMSLTVANLYLASGTDPFSPNTEDLLKAAKQPIPTLIDEFSPNTYGLLEEKRESKYSSRQINGEEKIESKPWRFYGKFSDIHNRGSIVSLNRCFCVMPYYDTSNIEMISIHGSKYNTITVFVYLHEKDPTLYKQLLDKNLLDDGHPWFIDYLDSRNISEVREFFNVFVERDLILSDVCNRILDKIKFENPKSVDWRKKLWNFEKLTKIQPHIKDSAYLNVSLINNVFARMKRSFGLRSNSIQEE